MAEFDRWAEYYDLIHDGLPGDVEFYVAQAVRAGGEALELGVGTGRIAIRMAMEGVNVTGLDNSPAMLAVCREKKKSVGKTPGTLTLTQGDMEDCHFDTRFSCIAMPYRTFMHLLMPEAQRRCLIAAHRHLADDGILVLDLWVPTPSILRALSNDPRAGKLKFAGRYKAGGLTVLHYHAASCDEFRQLLIEQHVIQEVNEAGTIVREVTLPLVRAWVTRREMDNLVRLCGFQVNALYGDFQGGAFTAESTEQIYVLAQTGRGGPYPRKWKSR